MEYADSVLRFYQSLSGKIKDSHLVTLKLYMTVISVECENRHTGDVEMYTMNYYLKSNEEIHNCLVDLEEKIIEHLRPRRYQNEGSPRVPG